MASNYDATEFIDGDFETHKTAQSVASPGAKSSQRASDEAEAELTKLLQQREEMKREQEELHRKIAAREETRRRQIECRAGRQEMVQNLIRGVGLLEEAEFNARRDAEQMAKALVELRDALSKVEVIQEETWAADKLDAELTRALTAIENARRFEVVAFEEPDYVHGSPIGGKRRDHDFGRIRRVRRLHDGQAAGDRGGAHTCAAADHRQSTHLVGLTTTA